MQPLPAAFYSGPTRAITALLYAISRFGLLAILALLLLSDGPVNPLRLMRYFVGLCLLPGLGVLAAERFLRGVVRLDAGVLILEQRHRRIEIPLASIVDVEPWLVPLPGSGLWLRLGSGSRWRDGVALDDPAELVEALIERGGLSHLGEVLKHPGLNYARARSRTGPKSWRGAVLKFPIFALVPTIPLFRVHQIIAYGGVLGEYYQYGLAPYLAGFAIYWATLTIYLLMYAMVLRVPIEMVAAGSALFAPLHAPKVRRVSERVAAILYFAGVPIAVALRFVPW